MKAGLMIAAAMAAMAGRMEAGFKAMLPGFGTQYARPRASRSTVQSNDGGPRRRDGWFVAQGKRMAKKARNVRRHRAACR